jgi:hypothetical protein
MSTPTLEQDIARGLEIRRQIELLQTELKAIEARIQAIAEIGKQEPLKEADREGKKFVARGAGTILPVIFESDLLIASFKPDSDTHRTLEEIAGDKLGQFFRDVRKFERVQDDGRLFRRAARATFEPDTYAAFIRGCLDVKKDGIPKSRVVVAWKESEPDTADVA